MCTYGFCEGRWLCAAERLALFFIFPILLFKIPHLWLQVRHWTTRGSIGAPSTVLASQDRKEHKGVLPPPHGTQHFPAERSLLRAGGTQVPMSTSARDDPHLWMRPQPSASAQQSASFRVEVPSQRGTQEAFPPLPLQLQAPHHGVPLLYSVTAGRKGV